MRLVLFCICVSMMKSSLKWYFEIDECSLYSWRTAEYKQCPSSDPRTHCKHGQKLTTNRNKRNLLKTFVLQVLSLIKSKKKKRTQRQLYSRVHIWLADITTSRHNKRILTLLTDNQWLGRSRMDGYHNFCCLFCAIMKHAFIGAPLFD